MCATKLTCSSSSLCEDDCASSIQSIGLHLKRPRIGIEIICVCVSLLCVCGPSGIGRGCEDDEQQQQEQAAITT